MARSVDSALPPDMALFLGNSMPVRYMDCFAFAGRSAQIQANRGLSGIDGNIATAVGMGWDTPSGSAALVGDMAALHDINSLALCGNSVSPFLLIIINNRGGRIFSHLPIAKYADVIEPCFVNPHSFHFEAAAQMFNIEYKRIYEKQELFESLKSASNLHNSLILEVMIDHKLNCSVHDSFFTGVTQTLNMQFAKTDQSVAAGP
ncbi:MAG TPA: thiamine pyrophosphate-binding protein [Candidatus Hydrogenedentes bacterium]|nr:thiamine pyrophosphate-binding protein [Candidatus Hydrogenedentota bacterium]